MISRRFILPFRFGLPLEQDLVGERPFEARLIYSWITFLLGGFNDLTGTIVLLEAFEQGLFQASSLNGHKSILVSGDLFLGLE